MRTPVMEKETIETYKNRLFQEKGAGMRGMTGKSGSECILFCKRVTPNVFDIKDGFAFIAAAEECFNDGVCMISNFTKVVLVFDQDQEKELNRASGK